MPPTVTTRKATVIDRKTTDYWQGYALGGYALQQPKQIQNMAGKAGRSGPPKGNLNATRNGTGLTRLTLGELPQTMRRQTQAARKYRRGLEALVVKTHGEISAVNAHVIDEASGAEVHASVCRWLLRTRLEKMSVSDVARCSEQIMKAKAVRNKAVERLKLDADTNVWDALYEPVDEQDKEEGDVN